MIFALGFLSRWVTNGRNHLVAITDNGSLCGKDGLCRHGTEETAIDTVGSKPIFGPRLRISAPTNSMACGCIFGLWMAAFKHGAPATPDKSACQQVCFQWGYTFLSLVCCLCRFMLLMLTVVFLPEAPPARRLSPRS